MKTIKYLHMTIFALIMVLVNIQLSAAEPQSTTETVEVVAIHRQTNYDRSAEDRLNPPLGILRGISNIAMGWTELPRCMVYDNAEVPFLGLFWGLAEGTALTLCRTGSGIFDIISFGFAGDLFHNDRFPSFFWETDWLPASK